MKYHAVPVGTYLERPVEEHLRNTRSDLSDAFFIELLDIGRKSAKRCGLQYDDVEDCAIEFVEHMMDGGRLDTVRDMTPQETKTWLYRCAVNWAKNSRRRLTRIAHREVSMVVAAGPDGNVRESDAPSSDPSPEDSVLSSEFDHVLGRALSELQPQQRDLFERRYLLGEDIAEIATTTGIASNAVRQRLWSMREHLRAVLQRMGVDSSVD